MMRSVYMIYPTTQAGAPTGSPVFACRRFSAESALEFFKATKQPKTDMWVALPATADKIKLMLDIHAKQYTLWKRAAEYFCKEVLDEA